MVLLNKKSVLKYDWDKENNCQLSLIYIASWMTFAFLLFFLLFIPLCHLHQSTALVFYKKRKWWLKLLLLSFSSPISESVFRSVDMSKKKNEHWEIIVRYNLCFQQIRCAVFFFSAPCKHAKASLKSSMCAMCSTLIWQRLCSTHRRR